MMVVPGVFSKLPIPNSLPATMERVITELKRTKSKEECLRKAFFVIMTKYRGERFTTYTRFWRAFTKDIRKLWARSGFLHCQQQNYLLRVLLVRSGKFTEQDIKQRFMLYKGVSPHQYLQVNVGEKGEEEWVDVDPWAFHGAGLPLGRRAGG
jgi:hypothetical protein